MSKIGKKPIQVPQGVSIEIVDAIVKIKGPKGEQSIPLHRHVQVAVEDGAAMVTVKNPDDRRQRALWGTFRALIENAAQGSASGWKKQLEIQGVGYKAASAGQKLTLNLGFSHPIEFVVPAGLAVRVEKNIITIEGHDRQAVGQFAARVRSLRKPEPYKGKGIRYVGEVVRRKAGKVVKAVGAG